MLLSILKNAAVKSSLELLFIEVYYALVKPCRSGNAIPKLASAFKTCIGRGGNIRGGKVRSIAADKKNLELAGFVILHGFGAGKAGHIEVAAHEGRRCGASGVIRNNLNIVAYAKLIKEHIEKRLRGRRRHREHRRYRFHRS